MSTSRQAFTLLETLLVLALLVIMAAMAWPSLTSPLASQRLKRAADHLRADWARARNEAMLSGETQAFLYLPGSGRYRIVAYAAANGQIVADQLEPSAGDAAGGTAITDGMLPAEVRFAITSGGLVAQSSESQEIAESQGAWSDWILFYPDGTATSATVLLEGEDGRRVPIELRGLTATTKVGDIMPAGEVGP